MITGAHSILYSADPDADRAFLRDVLGLAHVDAGGGWLIFALPPSEVAVHPADKSGGQELYFLVNDIKAFVAAMRARRIRCGRIERPRWGLITRVSLPGGGTIGVYEPGPVRPPAVPAMRANRARPRASAKRA